MEVFLHTCGLVRQALLVPKCLSGLGWGSNGTSGRSNTTLNLWLLPVRAHLCGTYCGNSAGCPPRLENVADYWSKLEYVTPTEEGSSLRHRPAHLSPKDRSHFKSGVLGLRVVEDTYPWPYWDAANLALRVSCDLVTSRMRLASRESRRL